MDHNKVYEEECLQSLRLVGDMDKVQRTNEETTMETSNERQA